MAIDRYIAICNPLHYPTIMTPKLCIHLTAGSCLCGFLLCFLRFHGLPPCLSVTQQIFCDSTPVLSLACTDTSLVVIVDAIRAVEILASFLVIALSYNRIIVVIVGMASAEGRHKAFSTCAAHLAVFLLYFWQCGCHVLAILSHLLSVMGHNNCSPFCYPCSLPQPHFL